MGLIQIRERSERLGGLPGVRMADTRTGAADALMGISRAKQASRAADAGIVSTIGGIAQGAAKIAAKFLEERDRDAADAAAQAYMKEKRAEYFGTTDENGNFVAGRLQRNMEDPGSYVEDAQDYDKDLAERHFGGLSKNARQMAERAVAGLDLQTQNAVVARASKEWHGRRVAAAEEGLRQHSQNVLDIPDTADAGVRAAAWGAWNDQVERILDVQGVTDPAARREFRRKNAEALVTAALARKVQSLKEQTNGLAPEAVEDAFDGLEGKLSEDGYRAVIYGKMENAAGEPLADWLDDDRKTSDHKSLKAALADQLEKAKSAAMREAEAWERQQAGELVAASANAIANGGLDKLDAAAKDMDGRAKGMAKGSRLETVALREAKRLDAAAQAEADRLTWDGIIEHAGDKNEWKPPEGRQSKNYKRLKESFDRQVAAYNAETMLAADAALKEERRSNEAAIRTSMLDAVSVAPGAFAAKLAERAASGEITLGQYNRLRNEFNNVWMQKGMPEKAKALVDILKREFYQGAEYDLSDRLAVNPKTGRFEYAKDPETKKPFEGEDVEFEARVHKSAVGQYSAENWFGLHDFLVPGYNRGFHYEMETRKLTSAEQLELLDIALDLAQYDGDEIHFDPVTKEPLDKPRAFNAADEFQRVCTKMKHMKGAETAGERVAAFAATQAEVKDGFGRFERGKVAEAEKREAGEAKVRQAAKAAKGRPFAPKMPASAAEPLRRGEPENRDGNGETEE